MGKTKLTYWQRRFLQIAVERNKADAEYIKDMQKRQRDLSKSIQIELNRWFERYGDNEGISRREAQRGLAKREQREWSMTLDEYRRKAIDGGYEQELNKEYFSSRISRLEQLQRQLYFEFSDTANQEEGYLSNYLQEALNTSYLRHIYELSDRGNLSLRFEKYSSRALELAIRKPWQGSNFSKRVWKNHIRTMPDRLARTMSLAIVNGWGVDRTVKEMMANIDKTLRHRMVTLVQTESAHLAEVANGQSMAETGVERWEWLATLEAHTCDICASYDGKEYDIDDRQAPICPAHPNCRCTKIPVSEGWQSAARWQRDPVTGEGSVGDYMPFSEWREKQKKSSAKESSVKEASSKILNDGKLRERKEMLESFSEKLKKARDQVEAMDRVVIETRTKEAIDNYIAAVGQFNKLRSESMAYEKDYVKGNADRVKELLSEHREFGSKNLNLKKHITNGRAKMSKKLLEAYDYYPTDWIKRSMEYGTITSKKVNRGYYRHGRNAELALSGRVGLHNSLRTAIHELAHRQEYINGGILKAEKAFYDYRTKGEELVSLKKATGINYGKHEMTKIDRFLNAYMGKEYPGNRAYELLTMGMDTLYADPLALAKDKEMFDWVIEMLLTK